MKNLYTYLILVTLSVAGCSQIDPIEDDNDSNQTERPVYPDDDDEKDNEKEDLVMIYGMKIFDDDIEDGHLEFKYDKMGRLISIYTHSDDLTIAEYTYSGNKISVNNAEFGYGNSTISLSNNGSADQIHFPDEGYSARLSYDMEGYLSGAKVTVEGYYTRNYKIKNKKGNFTEIPSGYDDITVYADYTEYPDKYSIPLSSIMVLLGYDDMISVFFPMLRITGAHSSNLLKRYTYEDESWEFSYQFDNKGNIESMTMSCYDPEVQEPYNMHLYFDCGHGFPDSMPETEDGETDQKLVKTITYTGDGEHGEYGFHYDEYGRIEKVTEKSDYSDREIIYKWDDKNKRMTVSPTSRYTGDPATYHFNDSWVLEKYESELGTRYMTYNDDGYIHHYETFNNRDFYCEWEGDDMISQTWYQNGEVQETTYFAYYDIPNKCNIDFLCYSESNFTPESEMSDRNIFRNFHSSNLLLHVVDENYYHFFSYETDSEGYPTKVSIYYGEGFCYEIIIKYYD